MKSPRQMGVERTRGGSIRGDSRRFPFKHLCCDSPFPKHPNMSHAATGRFIVDSLKSPACMSRNVRFKRASSGVDSVNILYNWCVGVSVFPCFVGEPSIVHISCCAFRTWGSLSTRASQDATPHEAKLFRARWAASTTITTWASSMEFTIKGSLVLSSGGEFRKERF